MNIAQCTNCQEPTKKTIGFWDGRDKSGRPTSGFLYDCNNTGCPIKQEAMKAELKAEQKELKTREENRQNGVDIQEMVRARRRAELTMRDCAQVLGVSLLKYSDYEHEREPMPCTKYQQIIAAAEFLIDDKRYKFGEGAYCLKFDISKFYPKEEVD